MNSVIAEEWRNRSIVYRRYPRAYQDYLGHIWTDDFYNCDSHCLSAIENVMTPAGTSQQERYADNWRIAAERCHPPGFDANNPFFRPIDPEAQIDPVDNPWLRSLGEVSAREHDYKKFLLGVFDVEQRCPVCAMLPSEHREGNASCVNFPTVPHVFTASDGSTKRCRPDYCKYCAEDATVKP